MQPDETPRPSVWEKVRSNYVLLAVASVVLVVLVILALNLRPSPAPTRSGGPGEGPAADTGAEAARQSLARQTDLSACRTALQEINAELNETPSERPPALPPARRDWLREHVGLDDAELAEVAGATYSQLDGEYLENCLLLRDAARALQVRGGREAPAEQAARAFAWVTRQVRLRPHEGDEVPPAFVLRRGWGSAAERALVFLALLEQTGNLEADRPDLLGFLLYLPGEEGKERFWACGVVAGDGKGAYLFDPRLGLPLPGPKGEGVATLAQARERPDVLGQLHAGDKHRYDVTAEQARAARARLVCPLSALAPRLRHLQDRLLAPVVRVRLAADPEKALERVRAAGIAEVTIDRERTALLRRFLPKEEGGADTASRKRRMLLGLVPWAYLSPEFRDEQRFPPNIGLGQRVRSLFAAPFLVPNLEPGQSRDQLLRGRFSSATQSLVTERDRWRDRLQERALATDLGQQARKWLDDATKVYALQLRARSPQEREQAEQQVKQLWSPGSAAPIYLLLEGDVATARLPEVVYQLALCGHEQAEQFQAREDVLAQGKEPAPHPDEAEKVRQAWQDARNGWKQLESEYPRHPDLASARLLRGRAEALLGDPAAAAAAWQKLPDPASDLEKLAALYLASRLDKGKKNEPQRHKGHKEDKNETKRK